MHIMLWLGNRFLSRLFFLFFSLLQCTFTLYVIYVYYWTHWLFITIRGSNKLNSELTHRIDEWILPVPQPPPSHVRRSMWQYEDQMQQYHVDLVGNVTFNYRQTLSQEVGLKSLQKKSEHCQGNKGYLTAIEIWQI